MAKPEQELTDDALVDLAQLAAVRVRRSLNGVTQLIDSDAQCYAVMLGAISILIDDAADLMQEGMERQNGKRPDHDDCLLYVMERIAHLLNLEVVKPCEPKSSTRSARS